MRKWLLPILLFLCSNVFAGNAIIGSGSGSINISSMSGRTRGDTLFITAGTYTSISFTNLIRITILPNTPGHTVFTTSESTFRNVDSCEIGYITSTGISGSAWDMRSYGPPYGSGNGPITHCYIHNMAFYDITSYCIGANGATNYVYGDSTTYAWMDNRFDSITEIRCAQLIQGSFGSPVDNSGSPPNVFVRTTITRFASIATTATVGEGTEVRGIQFECNYHDWTHTSITQRGNSGDDGLVYGHGSGTFYNMLIEGGPGYFTRMSPTREVGRPGFTREYNMRKFNTTDYGCLQHQDPDTVTAKFGAVDSINIYNITGIRMNTDNNYWCQDVVLGNLACSGGTIWMKVHVKNCIAIEIADAASGGAGHDGGTGTVRVVINMVAAGSAMDTSNNQYFKFLSQSGLDTTTVLYTDLITSVLKFEPVSTTLGNILHGGVTNPFTSVDYIGTAMRTPPDMGYLQVIPSSAPCTSCVPKYKWQKQIFR